jgi:hypothetical protein
MKGHPYLVSLLDKQRMKDCDFERLKSIRDQIRGDLKPNNRYNPRFYNGGSYGKKTMIKEAFDLDLVIYFPHTDSRSLKEMYTSVYDSLDRAGYKMTPRQIALTLQVPKNPFPNQNFHVDVITGKAVDEKFDSAYLYEILTEKRRRASLKMHIENVREVREVIKLMKLWIRRHSLNWQTFAMEQTVVRALKNQDTRDLGQCMEKVLVYIKSSVNQLRLIDPANSNNPIEIPKKTRLAIEQEAKRSFDALKNGDWKSIVW